MISRNHVLQRTSFALALASLFAGTLHAQENAGSSTSQASEPSEKTAPKKRASKSANTSKQLEAVQVSGRSVGFTNTVVPKEITQFQPPMSSVTDAVNMAPGVNITQGGVFDSDDYSTGITMRGFTQDTLGFTIDGLPNGSASYGGGSKPNRFLDSENLESATVSQGTADIGSPSLQALGGTLSYVSSDPKSTAGLRVDQSLGSWSSKRTFIRYDTGALFHNTTYGYISFSDTHNDRWINSNKPGSGHTSRQHVDAKLISYLTDSLTMTTRFSWDNAYENNYNDVTKAQFYANPRYDYLTYAWTGDPNQDQQYVNAWNTKRKNALLGVKFDYTINDDADISFYPYYHFQEGYGGWMPPYQLYASDASGNLTGGYPAEGASFTDVYYVDAKGNPLSVPAGCSSPFNASCYPAGAKAVNSFRASTYKNNRYGFTLNGHWNLGINHFVAGLWLEDQKRSAGRDWYAVLDTATSWHYGDKPYYIQFYDRLNTDTRKLYLQDNLSLGPVDVSVGLNKYLVHLTGDDTILDYRFASMSADSKVLPSVGAVWHITPQHQIYTSYTKNFAPPSDSVIQAASSGSDINNVKPQTSTNWDFGYRYQSRSLQASFALYHVRFANQINEITPDSNGITRIDYTVGTEGSFINVGGVESKGFEGLLNWTMSPMFDLYVSATRNDSTYLQTINSIVKGNQVTGSPERMLGLGLNFHDHNFRAGISGKYVGKRYGTLDNTEIMNPYTTFDAFVGYHVDLPVRNAVLPLFKSLDFTLSVTNFTDKHYLATLGDGSSDPGYYYIGAPRTGVFTVSANF
jgi:iron complex outermembrane receptor protein